MQRIRCVDCEGFRPGSGPDADYYRCGTGNTIWHRKFASRGDVLCLIAAVRADLEEPTLEYECLANSRAG
jgi:hypothetical protein